ncbi:MAG: hypothetical protein H6737_22755 [Alphaproteobacteria bacterium]|nr:hypothetical protein [Alphaproteobacteria bacterium]
MTVEIAPSAGAQRRLADSGEGIELSVTIDDGGDGDDATYVDFDGTVPEAGGELVVPAALLADARSKGLSNVSINAYSTRRRAQVNVLACEPWFGSVAELESAAPIRLVCTEL